MLLRLIKIAQGALRERAKAKDRSPHWPALRARYLKASPTCAACGSKRLMQVHHVAPYHLHPNLELEPTNLIGLCQWRLHHLDIGHGGNFQGYNPTVVDDAAQYRKGGRAARKVIVERAKRARLT